MKNLILAAIAMVAVGIGLGAVQPANAAGYGEKQQTGAYAPGGTAHGYLGGN